jgi:hypothetical protein
MIFMRNNNIIYMLCLIAAIYLTSCDNNLDEKVFSSIVEQSYDYSEKDWNANIAGVYKNVRADNYPIFWQTQELTASCLGIFPNISGWNDGGIFLRLHFHDWNSELGQINDIWNLFYGGVVFCNSALDRIEKGLIPAQSEDIKAAGIAEIRTVRAYFYWLICDNFGDAPLVTNLSQELPVKAKRTEIYDFIVKELTDAIPHLSEQQDKIMYARFNKWAAKCLLANVYLNAEVYTGTAHWEDCLKQCDDIINSGKCELSPDYKDSFRNTGVEDSKEILLTIPYDYGRGVTGNWLYMNSWHKELKKKFLTNATPNEAGGAKAIGQFIDTYQEGDGRLDDTWLHGLQQDAKGNQLYGQYDMPGEPLNFTKDLPDANYTNEMEGYRLNKYEVEEGAEWSSSTDIPIFRYSEVLLMKAECLLRTGKSGAGALVTQVRNRNFKDNPDKAIITDEQLKEDSSYPWGYVENYSIVDPGNQTPVQFGRLFDEYCWEFAYESHARRDMIRFGIFTTKSWLSHKPQGDYRTVFPIPERALTANPKLEQNPAYTGN